MPNILIETPFEQFTNKSGAPLASGYIYIGEPDKDPESFPLPVFFDADSIIAAPSPLRTNQSGFPTDGAGNPRRIYTTGQYSIRVRDANGVQIYYAPNSGDGFAGVQASELAAAAGAQLVGYRAGNVYQKLDRLIDVKDFGAVGDNITNDVAAFEAASALGVSVFIPPGQYNVPTGDFSGTVFYSFGGAQTNNGTVAIADVTAAAFPVGAVMQFPCQPDSLPVGFLPLDGSTLNRAAYPDLYSFAAGSGNIVAEADWAANKMSFSSGNGSTTFKLPDARGLVVAGADNGALVDTGFALGQVVERSAGTGADVDFRYGVQTIGIRAFSGAVNPGLVDITALGAQVGTNTSDITALEGDVAALPITKEFVSSDQTITAAGALTIAHTLGVVPKIVAGYLINETAEVGYSPGDIVPCPLFQIGDSASYGPGIVLTSANISLRFGSSGGGFTVTNFTTGGLANITAANWKLRIRAYA